MYLVLDLSVDTLSNGEPDLSEGGSVEMKVDYIAAWKLDCTNAVGQLITFIMIYDIIKYTARIRLFSKWRRKSRFEMFVCSPQAPNALGAKHVSNPG